MSDKMFNKISGASAIKDLCPNYNVRTIRVEISYDYNWTIPHPLASSTYRQNPMKGLTQNLLFWQALGGNANIRGVNVSESQQIRLTVNKSKWSKMVSKSWRQETHRVNWFREAEGTVLGRWHFQSDLNKQ